MIRPNQEYHNFEEAYDYYNDALFEGKLPPCLFTFTVKTRYFGYYRREAFCSRHDESFTDEIALNPQEFLNRQDMDILSTLAHEMCHQWQYHYGSPPKAGYHNQEWGEKMIEIGLVPSKTGKPGGKMTGVQMTHYIEPSGRFAIVTNSLLRSGFKLNWQQRPTPKKDKKPSSKCKYECPTCDLKAWAKKGVQLGCIDCGSKLNEVG